ncbi:MAG: cardiolipin synthase [Halobacteriovoraceae bacterium]|nr:cardiolipin synthase [Halobacteriovoraceae bacterium]|tara:strand:+ start:17678 stop:19105 length:1428 start_codon:yes stop_codon:yes gene_type:complete
MDDTALSIITEYAITSFTFLIYPVLAIYAAIHAVLYKRDAQAAAAWVGLILLAPFAGVLLYWLLGINRARSRALKVFNQNIKARSRPSESEQDTSPLLRLIGKVSFTYPIREGNEITPLINGEQAYPEMLKAIRNAKSTLVLCTYIFDNDSTGKKFAKAIKDAASRGVQCKIIIDAVGARYSFPTILGSLKVKNVDARKFHSVLRPWGFRYAQLRNHRKLMVVDGETGFFGGMNIRHSHLVKEANSRELTQDIHFKATGPILKDLMNVFESDWHFTTKEVLGEAWRPKTLPTGKMAARVLPNGPDEKFDQLRWILLGAVGSAEKSIAVHSPYFVPDDTLISALSVAALKGVLVDIIIPRHNNHKLVQWASLACMPQLLRTGCRVWLGGSTFDHSKILIIDGRWCMIGSSNWDARSFRLNFEINVDSTDKDLCDELKTIFDEKLASATRLSKECLKKQGQLIRLRNSCARLLGPYL